MSTAISKFRSRWENVVLELLIFSTIDKKPAYGGRLLTLARELISTHIKIPTVYAILKRGVQLKLLIQNPESEKNEITRGTARRYYEITDAGQVYFKAIKEMVASNLNTISELSKGGKQVE